MRAEARKLLAMNDGTNTPAPSPAPQPTQPNPPASQLHELLAWLDGKKTHLCVAAGILYVIGSDIGWWPWNEQVLSLMGLGALSALRHGITKGK